MSTETVRSIGLGASTAIILGNMVGLGIFLTPSEVAQATPNWMVYLLLWLLGGVMAASGAHIYAELGVMFPKAGGDYVFLYNAFGRPSAIAWGLLSVFCSFPGSLAALAVGAARTIQMTSFGEVLSKPLFSSQGWTITSQELLAVGIIMAVTVWNSRGVIWSSRFQQVLAWIPIGGFAVMAILALALAAVNRYLIGNLEDVQAASTQLNTGPLASAACAVFFTYSGWNVLTYMAGEVKRPSLTIPLAARWAVGLVILLYLALNVAFLTTLTFEGLRGEGNAGVAVARKLLGPLGGETFGIAMFLVITAGVNSTAMAGSRVTMAIAADGQLWPGLARLHPVRRVPTMALWVQACLAIILVLTSSFQLLISLTGGVMLLASCATVSTIFVFRRNEVGVKRYPLTALLFLVGGIPVLVLGLLTGGIWPLVGIAALTVILVATSIFRRQCASQRQ